MAKPEASPVENQQGGVTPSVLPRPDFHFPGEIGRTYLNSDPGSFHNQCRLPKAHPIFCRRTVQMNRAAFVIQAVHPVINRTRTTNTGALFHAAVLLTAIVPAIAQTGGGLAGELQQKFAAVKQSVAENQQKLHQYQWTEMTQLTLKGDAKPPKTFQCQYGPDGTVQKTPVGAPPPEPSGGRMKQKIIEKKKEEMQDYMGQVKVLLAQYVPPDPQKMEQAFRAGNASLNPNPGEQAIGLVFKNYAQSGDQMTLSFDTATKKVSSLNVNTYMDDPKDVVTLAVQMASLPDGTNYVQQTVLDATAKKLQVTTTNSNYQKLSGY